MATTYLTLHYGHAREITYTNWKGETSTRRVVPQALWFGTNEWHKEPQWILEVYDLEKLAMRSFALAGIKTGWDSKPVAPVQELKQERPRGTIPWAIYRDPSSVLNGRDCWGLAPDKKEMLDRLLETDNVLLLLRNPSGRECYQIDYGKVHDKEEVVALMDYPEPWWIFKAGEAFLAGVPGVVKC